MSGPLLPKKDVWRYFKEMCTTLRRWVVPVHLLWGNIIVGDAKGKELLALWGWVKSGSHHHGSRPLSCLSVRVLFQEQALRLPQSLSHQRRLWCSVLEKAAAGRDRTGPVLIRRTCDFSVCGPRLPLLFPDTCCWSQGSIPIPLVITMAWVQENFSQILKYLISSCGSCFFFFFYDWVS